MTFNFLRLLKEEKKVGLPALPNQKMPMRKKETKFIELQLVVSRILF